MIAPKKDEIWFVKVDNSKLLSKMKITDISENTIEISTLDYFPRSYRYERKDVELIEKIK